MRILKAFLGILPFALLILCGIFRLIAIFSGDLDYQTLSEAFGVAGLTGLFVKLLEAGTRPST